MVRSYFERSNEDTIYEGHYTESSIAPVFFRVELSMSIAIAGSRP